MQTLTLYFLGLSSKMVFVICRFRVSLTEENKELIETWTPEEPFPLFSLQINFYQEFAWIEK